MIAGRLPVRHDTDGDFTTAEILEWAATGGPVRPGTAAGTSDGRGDEVVMREFETSQLFRPPVGHAVATLTPDRAEAWLALAARWVTQAFPGADVRYVNTACKLLGAVWLRARSDSAWPTDAIRREIGAVAAGVEALSDQLIAWLRSRPAEDGRSGIGTGEDVPSTPGHERTTPTRVTIAGPSVLVLSGAGSSNARRFAHAAAAAGLSRVRICEYGSQAPAGHQASSYDEAWYPAGQSSGAPAPASFPSPFAVTRADGWDRVRAAAEHSATDLVVLLGMPVVPMPVLGSSRFGAVNAHNGALPGYRGMDAVGWALLEGTPPTCTVHRVSAGPDTGDVVTAADVPITPLATLRRRMKEQQLRLLLDVTTHLRDTGTLPLAVEQPADAGRTFYRLHPHLKRVLNDGMRRP